MARSIQDQFRLWKARISISKKWREPLLKEGRKNVDAYYNKLDHPTLQGIGDVFYTNLVFVDIKQSVPEQYSKNPHIFFTPNSPGSEQAAEIKELLVNPKWEKLKMKELSRELIKATKLYGIAAFKTYYQFEEDFVADEFNDRIQNDDVRTDVLSLENILRDSDAPSWHKARWIAHEQHLPIGEIREKFKISKDENVTPTCENDDLKGLKLDEDIERDFQYGTFYEIEDRKEGKTLVIVEGMDGFAMKPTDKKYPYQTMYDFLMYNDIPGRADPQSDYKPWRGQLIEKAIYRTILVNHARKSLSKYKVYGELSPEQRNQLITPMDKGFIELQTGQDIIPLEHAQLDQALFVAENAVSSDIQLISKNAPRQPIGGDKTATEIKANEAAAMQTTSENMERLEEVLASVANKHAQLMEEYYMTDRIVAISEMPEAAFMTTTDKLNKDGQEIIKGSAKAPFVAIKEGTLKGSCSASIKAGSTRADSEQTRIGKLQGFVQYVTALGPQAVAQLDLEEVVKEGEKSFDVRNENLLARKDNPMEESRLLNSGVFISAKMTEDHEKHLTIHRSETNNNQQNIIHILEHEMFKQQIEKNNQAQAQSIQMKNFEAPLTGQSNLSLINGQDASIQGAQPQPMGGPEAMAQPGINQLGVINGRR